MATIKIDIETEGSHSVSLAKSEVSVRSVKVGFLSSLKPTAANNYQNLIDAFEAGLGINNVDKELGETDNYSKDLYKNKKTKLKQNKNCRLIATAGGTVVFEAIRSDPPPPVNPLFVSLLGNIPASTLVLNGCMGGISLESINTNSLRKTYLTGLGGGGVYTNQNIYLLSNLNSEMHGLEQLAWGNNTTYKVSYSGTAGGINAVVDPTTNRNNFVADFSGDPGGGGRPAQLPNDANPAAVIISDDPFFQANRAELINAANNWIGTTTNRYVVYPSLMYASATDSSGNTVRPKANRSATIGPDLITAYGLLGALTRYIAEDTTRFVGFITMPSLINPL
jgi:hypothetical protein